MAVDGNTGDADLHNSILRRTQYNVMSRAQGTLRGHGQAQRVLTPKVTVPPNQTKPGEEESNKKVEGMLDPVSGSGLGERLITTPNQYTSGGTEGLAQFKKGFLRFKQEVINTHADHFKSLAASQSPKVMVIACCDSRVDPALLMGAGPGDIFTVRCVCVFLAPVLRDLLLTCCSFRALSRAATSRT
jgi:Carbonic anhydrase